MKYFVTALLLFTALSLSAKAQILYSFNDGTANPTVNLAFGTAYPFTIGNSNGTVSTPISTSNPSSGYAGASGTYNIGNAMNLGTSTLDLTNDSYFQVVLQPLPGYKLDLSGISFGAFSTSTGSQDYSIAISTDGFVSNSTILANGTVPNDSTWTLKTNTLSYSEPTPFNGNPDPVTLRIYGYGGTGSLTSDTVNTQLDDISITGYSQPNFGVPAVPEPSTYALLLGGLGILAFRRRRTRRSHG